MLIDLQFCFFIILILQISCVNFYNIIKRISFHQRSGKNGTKNAIKKVWQIRERVFIEIFIYYIYVGSTTGTAATTTAAAVPRAII